MSKYFWQYSVYVDSEKKLFINLFIVHNLLWDNDNKINLPLY